MIRLPRMLLPLEVLVAESYPYEMNGKILLRLQLLERLSCQLTTIVGREAYGKLIGKLHLQSNTD